MRKGKKYEEMKEVWGKERVWVKERSMRKGNIVILNQDTLINCGLEFSISDAQLKISEWN